MGAYVSATRSFLQGPALLASDLAQFRVDLLADALAAVTTPAVAAELLASALASLPQSSNPTADGLAVGQPYINSGDVAVVQP